MPGTKRHAVRSHPSNRTKQFQLVPLRMPTAADFQTQGTRETKGRKGCKEGTFIIATCLLEMDVLHGSLIMCVCIVFSDIQDFRVYENFEMWFCLIYYNAETLSYYWDRWSTYYNLYVKIAVTLINISNGSILTLILIKLIIHLHLFRTFGHYWFYYTKTHGQIYLNKGDNTSSVTLNKTEQQCCSFV